MDIFIVVSDFGLKTFNFPSFPMPCVFTVVY